MKLLASVFFAGFIASPINAENLTRAEKIHRPADAISAFVNGCIVSSPNRTQTEAVFQKFGLASYISNKPTGSFPAGWFLDDPTNRVRAEIQHHDTWCAVRIRGLWANRAGAAIQARLSQLGFKKTDLPSTVTPKRRSKAVINAIYKLRGVPYVVIAIQLTGRGGRITDLAIGKLR